MKTYSTIGTGWIVSSFIEAVNKTEKAELVSVYSRTEEKAKQFAAEHDVQSWYTDIDEMLKEDTDFIYIASPNILHFEQMVKAIKQKKHVFCEKPMVLSETQWKDISRLAAEYDVFVLEGFRHLYTPNYQKLKESIPQIGPVRSAVLQYIQYSSRYDKYKEGFKPNVFTKEFAGGSLMDLGVYPLSMAIDLFGEPEGIQYFPVQLKNGVDGSGTLVLTYEDFVITILCSKIAQGLIPSEIHGEAGTLTVDHIAPISRITYYDRKAKQNHEWAEEQHEMDMIYEAEEFIRMITENDVESYEKSMERSRLVVKWLDRVRGESN
ncbi:Gfo/Idh/MocA family protein [Oceanobacillus senegalensis]|uniref:Gfo/Idh/MocA family protein n=1 Tax=Oceanobacillus senegalensis TaxID=1936063 RepID=UPI000A309D98|nr:Gfo/Idh/MocA family oxidoreductase [Oceanobacillus senegalensis]